MPKFLLPPSTTWDEIIWVEESRATRGFAAGDPFSNGKQSKET